MTDIAAIGTILSSVKTATEIAKLIKDSDVNLEKAEFKLQLAELISALADAKIELSNVLDVIAEKDKIISELESSFEMKENLIRLQDAYYKTDENGKAIGTPYCLGCWESEHKASSLHRDGSNENKKICTVCKTSYQTNQTKNIVPV